MTRLAGLGGLALLWASLVAAGPALTRVEWLYCSDGDTCVFTIPAWPPVVGTHIGVRLLDVDTPEMDGRCEAERQQARRAQAFLTGLLQRARRIEIRDVHRDKYFRLLGRIYADGINVSEALLQAGLAAEYHGGQRPAWCPETK